MQRREKTQSQRACERCGESATRLYRVSSDSRDWQLICRACYDTVADEPGYRYGGTWTGRKRH